jgi:hypothetical protein
MKTKMFQDL